MIHNCPDCGLVHDQSVSAENPEVAIARIQAESAFKIAQLQARTDKHVAEVGAEAAIEVTEAEAEGDVAVAEIVAPELGTPELPEPAPVVVQAPAAESEPDDDLAPPEAEHEPEPVMSAHHRRTGLGMW